MSSRITIRQIILICTLAVFTSFVVFAFFEPSVAIADQGHPGDHIAGHTHDEDTPATQAAEAAGPLGGLLQGFSNGLSFVLAWIAVLGLQWGIFIMAVFGVLLDVSLLLTFNMGAILAQGTSIGDAIAQAWTIFRDLANLMFIAAMVWVSVAMILQVNIPGGSVGKFIANIIVAALLVNFSYFFTGVIIDASNNVSRLIYQEGVLNGKSTLVQDTSLGNIIREATGGGPVVQNNEESNLLIASFGFIGSQFVHQTKLNSIISPGALKRQISLTDGNYTIILIAIVGAALITATIQLFASLFFLIIGRFILLIILLVLSPLIVFKIMGIEPFSEWGDQWWKSLMSQVIFLPVFLFLTAISFRITKGFIDTVGGGDISIADIVGTPSGTEWNLAIGLIITYIIAWGLLKQAKTISENIAQGKTVELPSVEAIQGGAAKLGATVGGFGERTATLPRVALRAGAGGVLRGAGNLPGVRQVREGITDGVSNTWKGGRALIDPSYRYQYEREQRAKDQDIQRMEKTQQEIRELEAAAAAASDPVERAKINQQVDAAKERLRGQADSMYESLRAPGMAKQLGKLDAATQQAVLDSLDDEKAREVYDELRKQGQLKTRDKSGTTGSSTGESSAQGLVDSQKVVTELKGLRRDSRIASMHEKKRDMAEITATRAGAKGLKDGVGPGTLGELPVDVILENDAVRHEMDEADFAVLAGREDVSNDEYEEVKHQWGITKERAASAQPADIARPPQEKVDTNDTDTGESPKGPGMGSGTQY